MESGGIIKQTRKNRIILAIQRFLRFIDVPSKIEQKLYGFLEMEEKKVSDVAGRG